MLFNHNLPQCNPINNHNSNNINSTVMYLYQPPLDTLINLNNLSIIINKDLMHHNNSNNNNSHMSTT